MNACKFILLAAYFLAALFAVSAAKEFFGEDKRANNFILPSRYGRAGRNDVKMRRQQSSGQKDRKDSFYVPRYGKRSSSEFIFPSEPNYSGTSEDLTCVYSGVADLYRCVQSYSKELEMDGMTSAAN